MRPFQNTQNVILSPSPAVILSEAKDLGGLRINASEGSGFSVFFVDIEILHPTSGGIQNDKINFYEGF
jgi:hypothetical protein